MVIGGKFANREGPAWLPSLLTVDTFFAQCTSHTAGKNEKNHFCFDCHLGPLCPEGLSSSHKGHAAIQIRRASHRDVVRIADIQKYVDLASIQPYTINSAKIVFLQSRPQPKMVKGASHYCETCHRSIADPVRFCSILCKMDGIRANPHDFTLTLTQFGKPGQGFVCRGASDSAIASPEASTLSHGSAVPDFMPSTPKKASKRAGNETQATIPKKLKLALAAVPVSGMSVDEMGFSFVMAPSTPTFESGPRVHSRKQVRPHRSPMF